jgi:hypothetical protein
MTVWSLHDSDTICQAKSQITEIGESGAGEMVLVPGNKSAIQLIMSELEDYSIIWRA